MRKIAVVMSIYHKDRLVNVKTALESLYAQTYKTDIFLQQDGPIASDVENYLDQEYKKKHIFYLGKRNKNQGLSKSLNELLCKVYPVYVYIARMDADDISLPYRIALQYDFMKKNPEIDVVGAFIEEFSDNMSYEKIVCYPVLHNEMYDFFSRRVPLAHVTAFFRRSFFEKAGFYPTESLTNEDTLLWMKGFRSECRFANIPEVLVKVRVSSEFFSRRGGVKKAWSDFQDRILVIRTLGYNIFSYFYALALFIVNIAPSKIKQYLYQRLR